MLSGEDGKTYEGCAEYMTDAVEEYNGLGWL